MAKPNLRGYSVPLAWPTDFEIRSPAQAGEHISKQCRYWREEACPERGRRPTKGSNPSVNVLKR